MSSAANDGLKYPGNFQGFMSVVDRWHRARVGTPQIGESVTEMLLRTSHELDDAVAIFRQVWAKTQAEPEETAAGPNPLQQRIAELVGRHGDLRAVARVLQIDHAYLWRLYNGEKANPGDKLLRKLKLRRVVSFERVEAKTQP